MLLTDTYDVDLVWRFATYKRRQ